MADTSIPKLNRLDANTVANTDVLLIVDDPQGNPENKKIQVGELFSGSQSERLPNDGLKEFILFLNFNGLTSSTSMIFFILSKQ